MADERASVLYDWMAGYGAEPTPERPRSDACDRPLLADGYPMHAAARIGPLRTLK